MRAREFVLEDVNTMRGKETATGADHVIPGARIWPELDNSSPYMAYRYGIALAGAPHNGMPKKGPVKQNMVTLGYTEEDDAIAVAAGKIMGVKSRQLTPKGSTEMSDTGTTSPVAKKKKNRFGV